MTSYNELESYELLPGIVCTVLGAKRKKKRRHVPGVSEYAPGIIVRRKSDDNLPFQGYPLQVLHCDRSTPYVVLRVLGAPVDANGERPRTVLDTRRVRFCRLPMDYVRSLLGGVYQTTL